MVFRQLYYTSCEVGLSGYPGFQFNATSPGIAPELLRRVESFTAYDPPSSLPYNADAAAIAACPVNLCFSPAEDGTVLANVVFVGADYSNRFGNYFAHALVTEDTAADLGEALPIELWGAPVWTSTPVTTSVDLPVLSGQPPRGQLDRRRVAAFLQAHGGRAMLPALLSAAARVVTGERQTIVLVEQDSEAAASWIGAVSYLLPPSLAQRMSFATYHHRPAYSDLNLVATVPDADVDRSDGAFASFLLFDLPAARSSEVPVEPWADLLVETGVEHAGALWAAAAELGGGIPNRSAQWHPLLAAALFWPGERPAGTGPTVVAAAATAARWLSRQAAALDPRTVERIGVGALQALAEGRPAGMGAALTALTTAAEVSGAERLAVAVEMLAVDLEVEALLARQPADGTWNVPLQSAAGRAHARDRCTQALYGAPDDVATALLHLAAREELDLAAHLLRACGERLIGPAVLAGRSTANAELMRAWAPLRAGVVRHLAAVATDEPDRLVAAIADGLVEPLSDDETQDVPALHEARLIARSRRDPRLRVDTLAEIARLRTAAPGPGDGPAVRADLLRRIWPGGAWTPAEALGVLQRFDDAELTAPAPLAWLNAVFTLERPDTAGGADLSDLGDLGDLEELCHAVEQAPIAARLSQPARATITRMATIGRRLAAATAPDKQAAVLTSDLDRLPETQRRHNLGKLTELLNGAAARELPAIFESCPPDAVEHYLVSVHAYLGRERARADIAGRLFYVLVVLRRRRAHNARAVVAIIERHLLDELTRWHSQDLQAVQAQIRKIDSAVAAEFADWRDLNAAGWLRRMRTRRRLENEARAPRQAVERKKKKAERKKKAEQKRTKNR
ncbi:GTPase-associated protein 1-related protein [Frankia tisae]|uniref:GTPase-associated protein 1-related protein n=1 Tax=Frankia tisae TaxID=2950104 RepID=UPI0021C18CC3|nr:GTPase-associated protein 1-related protein [Frankia tisae]